MPVETFHSPEHPTSGNGLQVVLLYDSNADRIVVLQKLRDQEHQSSTAIGLVDTGRGRQSELITNKAEKGKLTYKVARENLQQWLP